MAGFLNLYDDLDTIYLGPDPASQEWWAKLRRHVTNKQSERATRLITGELVLRQDGSQDQRMESRPDIVEWQRHMVLARLAEWNLTDHSNAVMTISLETLTLLPDEVFAQLFDACRELDQKAKRSPQQEQAFRTGAS